MFFGTLPADGLSNTRDAKNKSESKKGSDKLSSGEEISNSDCHEKGEASDGSTEKMDDDLEDKTPAKLRNGMIVTVFDSIFNRASLRQFWPS